MSDLQVQLPGRRRRGWLWIVGAVVGIILLIPLLLIVLLWSGWANEWIQRSVTSSVGTMTGGRVELGPMTLDLRHLGVSLENITVHGREPAGTPPFFHADRLDVAVSIDNFWSHKVSLRNVELTRPSIHLRFEKNGSNNPPTPRPSGQPSKPLRERLFSLLIRCLRINDGELLVNDVRIPLVAQGDRFEFALDYTEADRKPTYLGDFSWKQFQVAVRRYLPFGNDISIRF